MKPALMNLAQWVGAVLLAGSAAAWGQAPVITLVTDARGNPTICPSGGAQIFGTWPVDAARNWAVTVGGKPGRVSASWIVSSVAVELDIEVPAEVPVGNSTVVISHLGTASNAFPVNIVPVDPVIGFDPYSAFDHLAGVAITATSPAAPGETATTFMTGLGLTTPVVATATSTTTFSPTAQTTTVTVAGEPATVQFAGLYPGGQTGTYQVSFAVPADTPSGPQPVIVTIGGVTSNTQTLFVGTQALSGQPVITAVANGASFSTRTFVSPGSFVSIFASGLTGPDNLSAFPNTTVNGISVLVNGKLAPIFALAASAGQINALVPTDADIGASLEVVVQNQNGPSRATTVVGGAAGPGIFLVPDPSSSTRTNAAATVANSAWLVIPASQAKALGLPACAGLSPLASCGQPAHPGDYVQLYTTGLGKATPNGDPNGAVLPTGQVAPVSGSPLYATVALPTVTVGGVAAKVVFCGLAPGFAGLYQVDFQIPGNAATGDNVALGISVPGSSTAAATIAIAAQ
jgi:uncharacterized protein (TIGR03437 family)